MKNVLRILLIVALFILASHVAKASPVTFRPKTSFSTVAVFKANPVKTTFKTSKNKNISQPFLLHLLKKGNDKRGQQLE